MKNLLYILPFLVGHLFAQTPAPPTFTHQITYGGETVTAQLTKFSTRGPLFEVVVQQADGSLAAYTPGEVRTYMGTVDGYPGAVSAAIIRADGEILARAIFRDGAEWSDAGGVVSRKGDDRFRPTASTFTVVAGETAGSEVYAADIAVDLPYPQIISSGGTVGKALEVVEYSFLCMNMIYLRDTAIINRVGRVQMRFDEAQDPYQGMTTTGQMLSEVGAQLRAYVNEPGASTTDHDLALTASTQVGGGLAYVGTVGTGTSSNGSDRNGDFYNVGRHEIGHNWSLSHYDGGGTPEGNTINSGNALGKMSAAEMSKVIKHRNSRSSVLTNLGNVAPPLPPRAADDIIVAEIGSTVVTATPLSNDNDVNGEALRISSYQPATSLGGRVSAPSASTLEIAVPAHPTSSSNYLQYVISDTSGQMSQANVHLKTYLSGGVLGHWTFDKEETRALDSSTHASHGILVGGASLSGEWLHLDGINSRIDAEITPRKSNNITYSAHLYRDGDQNNYAGIIFQRNAAGHGLNFGVNNELRYHWDSSDWQFNSGLVVPDRTWCYVALVIEPDKATFYLDDGTEMRSAVRRDTHLLKDHGGNYQIGQDTLGGRYFKGMMDDVRIIDRALSAEEITRLAAGEMGASDPHPLQRTESSDPSPRLSWTPSVNVASQRLYLSTSYTELRDAVVGSPADLGEMTSSAHSLSGLAEGHYYWRVDTTETDGSVTKGNLWHFQIIPEGLLAHWPLSGTVAEAVAELIANRTAVVRGSPMFNEEGASLSTGSCVCFDGKDDYLEVPYAAELNPEEFTLSLWARVDGGDGQFRSPFTSRSGSKGYLLFATNQNKWSFWFGNGRNLTPVNDSSEIVNGKWYHLTATYDGEIGTLYVDGVAVASSTTPMVPNDLYPIRIGAGVTEGSPREFFVGCVDEVRIWDRAIDEAEIQTLRSYEQWADRHGLTDRSAGAVAGSNGLTNLQNYALNRSPFDQSEYLLVGPERTLSAVLPYPLRDDVSYTLAVSPDLSSESWVEDHIWERTAQPDSTIYELNTGAARSFFRLEVEELD